VQDRIGLAGEHVVDGGDIFPKPHRQFVARNPLPGRDPGRSPGPQHVGRSAGGEQGSRRRCCRPIRRDGKVAKKLRQMCMSTACAACRRRCCGRRRRQHRRRRSTKCWLARWRRSHDLQRRQGIQAGSVWWSDTLDHQARLLIKRPWRTPGSSPPSACWKSVLPSGATDAATRRRCSCPEHPESPPP